MESNRNRSRTSKNKINRLSYHSSHSKKSCASQPSVNGQQSYISKDTTEPTSKISNKDKTEKPLVNYQEEVINMFYNSMLDLVVDQWNPLLDDEKVITEASTLMPPPPKEELKIESKDFKNLTDEDIQNYQIVSVNGSQVSFTKKAELKNKISDTSTAISEITGATSIWSTVEESLGAGHSVKDELPAKESVTGSEKDMVIQILFGILIHLPLVLVNFYVIIFFGCYLY